MIIRAKGDVGTPDRSGRRPVGRFLGHSRHRARALKAPLLTRSVILQPSFAALQKVHSFNSSVRSSRQQPSARPLPRLRPQPRPPPQINNRTNPLQLALHAQTWERKEVETGDKNGSEGQRKGLASLCVFHHHTELGIVMSASLLQFSNSPSGKPACLFFILQDSAFRIAIRPESISPCDYKMVSRQVCPLVCQQKWRLNNWVIIGSYRVLPHCERFTRPSSFWL